MADLKEQLWQLYRNKNFEGSYALAKTVLDGYGTADALHIAGLSLVGQGCIEQGYNICVASLLLTTPEKTWPRNCALAFLARKEYDQALEFIHASLEIDPDDAYSHYVLGLCLSRTMHFVEALVHLDKAIALDPSMHRTKAMRGFALHALLRHDEAISCYEDVLRDHPDMPARDREDVVNNLHAVWCDIGEPRRATAILENDYADSTNPLTIYNRSICYLGFGAWPVAWEMYRTRYEVAFDDRRIPASAVAKHANSLSDLQGRSVMMYHEQGLGDTIQFLRYAPMIRPLVDHLTLLMQPQMCRLARLLALDDTFDVVANLGDEAVYEQCPVTVCMMDAPYLFSTTVETIPGREPWPYLRPIPPAVVQRRALPPNNKIMRVGVCWAGAPKTQMRSVAWDPKRSMPFKAMRPILMRDGFDFVSLQMGNPVPTNGATIHEPITGDFDLLDTAAIIEQCDLVITVDTSIAHLAGAMHKPTWLLLCYGACWRWFYDGRRTSPWYPTMRLYRQPKRGDWKTVIDEVCADLEVLCEERV